MNTTERRISSTVVQDNQYSKSDQTSQRHLTDARYDTIDVEDDATKTPTKPSKRAE